MNHSSRRSFLLLLAYAVAPVDCFLAKLSMPRARGFRPSGAPAWHVPIAAVAFILSWLLPEVRLRATTQATDIGHTFAMPTARTSQEEIEQEPKSPGVEFRL